MTLSADRTDASSRSRSPAQIWSHRMPSPPRIIVPPPALATNGLPDLQVVQGTTPNFEASGFANTHFLETVTYNNFLKTNAMLEWKYEHRRQAQQVLPFLYLGPSSSARDENFLRSEGITMLLAVRNTLSAQAKLLGSRVGEALRLEVKNIDVAGNQELIAAFPHGIQAINTHLSQIYQMSQQGLAPMIGGSVKRTGKVLVFCESGNERSASLVAAYVMAMYSKDLVTTIQIVQSQRFAVAFDDTLKNLLATYEDILRAKRDITAHTALTQDVVRATRRAFASGGTNGKFKRSHDDVEVDDEDDMNKDYNDDSAAGIQRRAGIAPFQGR